MLKEKRPWGTFFVLQDEKKYKIKRIEVKPNHRLSYQYHNKRSEYWIIISGKAKVTIDDKIKILKAGETINIKCKTKHRVENCGIQNLTFIEIQTGSYFGEDDIVRIHDDYKRT